MSTLLAVLTPIALLDSVSITPLSLVPLLALLGSRRPLTNSVAFLSGIFVPYLAFGAVVMLGLASIFGALESWYQRFMWAPNTLEIVLQILLGAVMLVFGYRMGATREKRGDRGADEDVGPAQSFSIGFALTVVGLPGALPYFAAIDQMLRTDLEFVQILAALLYYNAVCSVPLVGILIARMVMGQASDALFERLASFFAKWGHRAIVGALALLGAFLVIDGGLWLSGRPVFSY